MQVIWQRIKQYRKLLIFLLIVAVASAGGWAYWKKNTKPVAVTGTVVTVGRGDIQSNVSATGTISAVNSVDISSRVTGLIKQLNVKENDLVSAGQVLVVLDDTTLRAQVAQYQAQLQNYAAIYERSKRLAEVGGESSQQLDADQTNYLVAQANYNNYAAQLDYYVITSPIAGVVVGKPTPAGQTVAQGISTPQVIMTIADMSQMQIKVQVDETDIGKVQIGQKVSFTVDAYNGKTFTGQVVNISKSATTSSNVVYYPVYVNVDNPEGLLYPTMTARVSLHVGERSNVLLVPLAAVKEDKGQKVVQCMLDGKEVSVPVEIGLSDEENIEILSGLSEGTRILLPVKKQTTATKNSNQGPPPPM